MTQSWWHFEGHPTSRRYDVVWQRAWGSISMWSVSYEEGVCERETRITHITLRLNIFTRNRGGTKWHVYRQYLPDRSLDCFSSSSMLLGADPYCLLSQAPSSLWDRFDPVSIPEPSDTKLSIISVSYTLGPLTATSKPSFRLWTPPATTARCNLRTWIKAKNQVMIT